MTKRDEAQYLNFGQDATMRRVSRRIQRVDKVATLSGKCRIAFPGIQDFLWRCAPRPEILQGSAYMPPPAD